LVENKWYRLWFRVVRTLRSPGCPFLRKARISASPWPPIGRSVTSPFHNAPRFWIRVAHPPRGTRPASGSNFAVAGIIAGRKTRSRNSRSGMHAVAAGLLVKWCLTGLHRVLPGFHRQAGQEWASRCSRRRTRLSLAPIGCTLVAPPSALLQFLIGDFRWSAGTLQQAER
jgi:hypothetical protein